MRIFAIILALISSAFAAPFPVTDDDQNNIASICALAAKSPTVDIAVTVNIATWCVNWQTRMKAAAQVKPADPPPPPEQK
jgi:hypothetical protein